jgi:hypothetical protein
LDIQTAEESKVQYEEHLLAAKAALDAAEASTQAKGIKVHSLTLPMHVDYCPWLLRSTVILCMLCLYLPPAVAAHR